MSFGFKNSLYTRIPNFEFFISYSIIIIIFFTERQHKEALENLKKKQEEVEIVATKKQTEMIDKLKLRISELEAEKEVQNERHQELILEMAELKKYGPESIASDIEGK